MGEMNTGRGNRGLERSEERKDLERIIRRLG